MELLSHLAVGFGVATQGINLIYALIGVLLVPFIIETRDRALLD